MPVTMTDVPGDARHSTESIVMGFEAGPTSSWLALPAGDRGVVRVT
jgi:hypothetical protein